LFLRSLIFCAYLMLAYWVSYHYPSMKMIFYPTLGAFSFLFMHRVEQIKDIRRIMLGAFVGVVVGCLAYMISTGAFSFFVTALLMILLIKYFKWNAAPILSVSFIPFFAHPAHLWLLPVTVLTSLLGLFVPIWLISRLEKLVLPVPQKWVQFAQQFTSKVSASIKREL